MSSNVHYVDDWSPVDKHRYRLAQRTEKQWWGSREKQRLTDEAKLQFYIGYYEWMKYGIASNPFRPNDDSPHSFNLVPNELAGASILDLGCGPMPCSLSLVHLAEVHVTDPLLHYYQTIQTFGWNHFSSASAQYGEALAYNDQTFDFVYCWNVLDHTQDAEKVLKEIARVLVSDGQLLLGCDTRGQIGGGDAHPYKWTIESLESGVFNYFEEVDPIVLCDQDLVIVDGSLSYDIVPRWICRMKKREI